MTPEVVTALPETHLSRTGRGASADPVTVVGLADATEWLMRVSGPRVIAVHDPGHVDTLAVFLAEAAPRFESPPVLLALDLQVAFQLKARGLAYVTPEQLLEPHDYDGIDLDAMALGERWPYALSPGGEDDVTQYQGISLAGLVQWEMTYALAEAMRCVVHMQRVIERVHPAVMMFLESPLPPRHGLLRQVGEDFHRIAAHNLPGHTATVVRVVMPGPLPVPRARGSRMAWMKARMGHAVNALMHRLDRDSVFIAKRRRTFLISGLKHIGDDVVRILARDHRARVIIAEESWSPKVWWRLVTACAGRWRMPLALVSLPRTTRDQMETALAQIRVRVERGRIGMRALPFRGVDLTAFLAERLQHLTTASFRELLMRIEQWRVYLSTHRVDVVVVNEDVSPYPKTLIRVAQQLKIPTVVVAHGVFMQPTDRVLNADYLAVWGEAHSRFMVAGGVDPRRIRMTGATRMDRLATLQPRRRQMRRRVCEHLGLNPEHPIILLTTQGVRPATHFPGRHLSPQENYAICRTVVEAARRVPNAQLIVKFHVAEPNARHIEQWLGEEFGSERVRFVQHEDPYRLLCATDCVVTGWSTTGLEAMALRLPVVVVRVRPQPYWMPYAQSGAALEAVNADELEEALRRVLDRSSGVMASLAPRMEAFWNQWCGAPLGEASRKLADFLMELR